jgi:N-acetylmuramoyl-L-alanine amidase
MAVSGIVFVLAAIFVFSYRSGERAVLNQTARGTKETVVIDAGHGGFDPGKVGAAGTLEKDINLAISQKLKEVLENSGYTVVMTREEDCALSHEEASSKKMSDLKSRVSIISETKPAVAVSIHQNSYSEETKGAQVFYYSASEESHAFATELQNALIDCIGDDNHRVEKGNDSYYMLKKTEGVFAIVECGFLSNPDEEELLKQETYQQKMAEAIAEGIENFLYKM